MNAGKASVVLAYLFLPPVVLWRAGRALIVDLLPRLLHRGWSALSSTVSALAGATRAMAVGLFGPIVRGVASSWRWLRLSVGLRALHGLRIIISSWGQALRRVWLFARGLATRMAVAVRGAARLFGAAGRHLLGPATELARRVLVTFRAAAVLAAAMARSFAVSLTGLGQRLLLSVRAIAKPIAISARTLWRGLAELGKRTTVAIRGAARVIIRLVTGPIKGAAAFLAAVRATIARYATAVLAGLDKLARRISLPILALALRIASSILTLRAIIEQATRWTAAIVARCASALSSVIAAFQYRIASIASAARRAAGWFTDTLGPLASAIRQAANAVTSNWRLALSRGRELLARVRRLATSKLASVRATCDIASARIGAAANASRTLYASVSRQMQTISETMRKAASQANRSRRDK